MKNHLRSLIITVCCFSFFSCFGESIDGLLDEYEKLEENGFEQYIGFFENQKVTDVDMFLSLREQDMGKNGITILGSRKCLINVLHSKQNKPVLPDKIKII